MKTCNKKYPLPLEFRFADFLQLTPAGSSPLVVSLQLFKWASWCTFSPRCPQFERRTCEWGFVTPCILLLRLPSLRDCSAAFPHACGCIFASLLHFSCFLHISERRWLLPSPPAFTMHSTRIEFSYWVVGKQIITHRNSGACITLHPCRLITS